ncbi:putative acid proteinase protein [Diplogelasinospora grovesii]|uniref:Acid proteinase protein n=1 Tax=Diplogelasinospora grovesii TaxID=303347 RepID=A0AAN6S1I5_9PEZI|nr:putative acid proteinase protein [Diplogelasinospora grovesii]
MKFTTTLLSVIALGASSVLATALPEGVTLVPRRPSMNVRRSARKTNPRLPVSDTLDIQGTKNSSHVQYSSNWAGAVLIGSGYKSVRGTITVPTPQMPPGGSSGTQYAASAWVGLDGDTCQTAILQTGVDFYVQGTSVSFDAWYEWYPDYAYTFSGFAISAGDSITMTATATSTSSGSVTIVNNTKGKSVTHSFSGESADLCETNAEWIVEDFEENGSLVPFADFGTVTFTGCQVTTTSGGTLTASGATILDIQQNGQVLTDCSDSGSSVTCTYV